MFELGNQQNIVEQKEMATTYWPIVVLVGKLNQSALIQEDLVIEFSPHSQSALPL
jgi:hypothetical protein